MSTLPSQVSIIALMFGKIPVQISVLLQDHLVGVGNQNAKRIEYFGFHNYRHRKLVSQARLDSSETNEKQSNRNIGKSSYTTGLIILYQFNNANQREIWPRHSCT